MARAIWLDAHLSPRIARRLTTELVAWLERLGPPPQILWLTCGNTSGAALAGILGKHFQTAMSLLESGEPLVEIAGL